MIAAISTGPETHLDHLVPLCALLEIPLFLTDPLHLDISKKFYPMVKAHYIPLQDLSLDFIAHNFSAILTCGKFWAFELKNLLHAFYDKKIHFIFAPHGNSDKESLLQLPIEQDIDLVYGPQMFQLKKNPHSIEIGNLRYWFYKKYQEHFDALATAFFQTKKKVVLYAPTWETKATASSFFERTDEVIAALSNECHLLIKLHPLLEENNPAAFYRILGKYENHVLFIQNFPAIYPLLERTDIYLGDYSSIGYDFLTYNRPMFFLKEGGKLQKCGELFKGTLGSHQGELSSLRKALYEEAFGKICDAEKIKTLLLKKVGL